MEIVTNILKEILKFQYIILPSIVLSVIGMEKRSLFGLRSIVAVVTYLFGSYFIYMLCIPVPKLFGAVDVSYIVMLVFAVIGCELCFRAKVKTVMFFTMSAYVVQNAAYNCIRIIIAVCNVEYRGTVGVLIQFFIYIISYIIYYFLFIRRLKDVEDIDWENRFIVFLVVFILVIVYVLSSFLTVYLTDTGTEILVVSRLYAMIACLLELVMQYTLCDKSKKEKENEILEKLLEQEEKQHERTKENIDLIDRKCHDLKHWISAVKRGRRCCG